MKDKLHVYIKQFGLPRIIIVTFLLSLCVLAVIYNLSIAGLLSDTLVRTGMHGVLVLAMVPGILCGIGLNFGLPLGILCGLIGGLVSIELDLVGFPAFTTAILVSIPIAIVVGWGYGVLLNRVKGSEMTIATYAGFSAVSLMSIGWMILPFKSDEIAWIIGGGLRTTITLTGRYDKILNDFAAISIGNLTIPTGLLLFLIAMNLIVWVILQSKAGIAMKAVGDNPRFATAAGLNVNKYRTFGSILSTVLGAIGIIVYSQSFGFIQLYQAPMFMGFSAVAAILIGGATVKKASISHVFIGTFLFQGLLVVALPVANKMLTAGSLAEITRIIVSNGIILYALTQVGGGE
ncbi:ABC transporter permease [Alkaliphilus pronyensis]|uniref:ABC transporter permease n=1 Tax=Alkaliphilus pronyensis TaxID=1482732 RepID=A0A6I0F895_9FIRM|nr:ABC transporter permease [Alkaliphilus pronyensis]KAB3531643.1 ABC transporter permease [Alkaliphilus pronyensis]